jgi:N-acetylglutamate synthase-like GNAT family acetyltransferase
VDGKIYEDCISNSINTNDDIPNWYLLIKDEEIIGCAGLISNDFVSRMDLKPFLCALYIKDEYRGNNYASLLINKIKEDTFKYGYNNLYICTDHIGFYEKHGFEYIGIGYHPWNSTSRIYRCNVNSLRENIVETIKQFIIKFDGKYFASETKML